MVVCLCFFLLLPLAIGAGLVFKSMGLFDGRSIGALIFSSDWSPSEGKFGFWPFILSSLWVTVVALSISIPFCLLASIYLTQFAPRWFLNFMRPVIDILAGIPSVVYGVWGVLVIVPLVSDKIAPFFGTESLGYSILAGALVLAVMSIPYILNMLLEVFRQIPIELGEASLSLGSTKWEMIKHIFLRKGATGIISAFGLGFSKALGETIAVMMVIGNVVQIPSSVFDAGYPLPALVANNYGEMMSIPSYDSALMFGSLLLFVIIITINVLFRYLIYKSEAL
ncbi:phosphate ABC transporter permease subunit PstC [Panacibacter ginsenosidivorans]|uniref:Phosphate transport system permease protein n=2 Tax=Panacibacter ginsenosidivorans TaxID=1813871 RepID=A0A5B8VIQ6_9BACT|nr:phosphate ABC transporter permease subunit PstC [Panacibacter ginsenosidivorans]